MAELSVPQVDFSSLGQLPGIYKQGQADALRQQTLANLGQGGAVDATALLKSGDLSLAQLGMTMQQRQAEAERQARQDARTLERDKVDDRFRASSLDLQRQAAARASEDKPLIKEVTDPNTGATNFVRINPRTGELTPLGSQAASTPNNPFSAGGKFNENQGKAAGFADRMLQSEGILSGVGPTPGQEGPVSPGVQGQGTNLYQQQASAARDSGIPLVGKIANYAISDERKRYDQAKSDFITAQLRRESGAAISPGEFVTEERKFFPQPDDSPKVIQQKANARRAAIEAMGREAGGSYKPKLSFDERGTVVPYGQEAARPAVQPSTPPPPKPGQLVDGFRYKGGNPADPASWVKAQ